ncbi:MAG: hypothetical protein AAF587_07605 [Bacteroidota bacterium]
MIHPLLSPLYDQLWESTLPLFQRRAYTLDPFLHGLSEDNRRGLTLIVRPSEQVKHAIQEMLHNFGLLLPAQHYYELQELHTTVLTLISCEPGFTTSSLDIPAYIETIEEGLREQKSPEIWYQGISASTSAIMVQGFPTNFGLEQIRDSLREAFRSSGLYHTIDKRYKLVTAHSTVMRFTSLPDPVENEAFVNLLASYRHKDFGMCSPSEVELVVTDWYLSKANARTLASFACPIPTS